MSTTTDLEVKRGDTAIFDLALTNAAGTAMNLAGATLRFSAKRSASDLDAAAVISKSTATSGISILDATAGTARLTISPSDTTSLVGDVALRYDLQVTDSTGVVTTLLEGALYVRPDITILSP